MPEVSLSSMFRHQILLLYPAFALQLRSKLINFQTYLNCSMMLFEISQRIWRKDFSTSFTKKRFTFSDSNAQSDVAMSKTPVYICFWTLHPPKEKSSVRGNRLDQPSFGFQYVTTRPMFPMWWRNCQTVNYSQRNLAVRSVGKDLAGRVWSETNLDRVNFSWRPLAIGRRRLARHECRKR